MWEEAIREIEAGREIDRQHEELLALLAEVSVARWEEDEDEALRTRAHEAVQELSEAHPHRRVGELRERLGSAPRPELPSPPSIGEENLKHLLTGALFVTIFLGGLIGFLLAIPDERPTPRPTRTPLDAVTNGSPSGTPFELDLPETDHRALEVTFADGPQNEGLRFDVRKSHLANYTENSFYTLWVDVVNEGSDELAGLQLTLELLDDSGAPIVSDSWQALPSYDPALRPGDTGVIAHLVRANPDARSVRVSVNSRKTAPAADAYEPARPIEVELAVKLSDGIAFEFRERSRDFSPRTFGNTDHGFFRAAWEIEHRGTKAITELKLRIDVHGKDGAVLDSRDRLVTYRNQPPIEPGEVRLESVIMEVPNAYDHYSITVVRAE